MTPLSKRQIEIITLLLLKDDYCKADDLADVLSVSNRTIRNDLSLIKAFLKEYGADLKAEPHKGYKIIADMDCRQKILGHLDSARSLTRDKLVNAICILLLSFDNTTYEDMASYLDISKQTLIKYMDDAEENLSKHNIFVNKIKGKGLHIEGKESNIRDYMKTVLSDSESSSFIISLAEKIFLNSSLLVTARQIIKDVETQAKVHFYEQRRLELLISYSLYRVSIGHILDASDAKDAPLANDGQYQLFYEVLKSLHLSEAEKCHLISVLLETKVKHLNQKHDNDRDAEQLAKFLMKKLQLLHPFGKHKKERFLNGLTSHLNVALYRIRNNIPIQKKIS